MRRIVLIILVLLLAGTALGEPDKVRVIRAYRTGTPHIDGVMETEWLAAEPGDRFIQRRPVEGAPESLPTRVYLLYDANALNVCFVCNDSPDSISARVLRRDNTENCDLAGIYLDTFHDHRNCYYFAVTASGVQIDGVVSNETSQDVTWDGIWQSAVGRTDSGWVAEMRIPFSTFRHGGERADGWGINFVRSVVRRQEALFWQPVINQRGLRVGEFGNLVGLQDIGSSRHLEVLPHAVGRMDALADSNWESRSEWEDLGFYAKYVPASSWAADFAYQPDFAQVDVDYEVISLSDYPVFYPEKRPFFLEVGNLFDTSPIQLLYTRRITNPDYVGRVYSQSEKFRGMVLGGQNRTEGGFLQSVAAGRAVLNAGKQSSIGLTGTFLQQVEGRLIPGPNLNVYTGGIDARIRWGTENRWTLAASGVDRNTFYDVRSPMETVRRKADAQPFEFRSDLYYDLHPLPLKANLVNAYLGQDYNINDLGWGNSSNKIQHSLWLGNWWQAPKQGFLQWGIDLNSWQDNLPDGRYPQGGGQINLWANTTKNWEFGGGTDWGVSNRRHYTFRSDSGEFRDNYFESLGRFDIEPHWYHTQWVWFETDDRRWLSYAAEGSFGNFREGHKWVWNQSLTAKPRANLETSLVHDRTQVWGVGDYDNYQPTMFRVWRWVTRYSPTLNLSFRGTLQWVEEDEQLLTNLLFAWNWHPGSWFYLVYDEGRATNPLAYNTEGDRKLQAKATYFFTVR